MSRCPLVWLGALATVALALGVDKGYVAGATMTLLCVIFTLALAQLNTPWLWWGSVVITVVVAASSAFYAFHCKPLADARRLREAQKSE